MAELNGDGAGQCGDGVNTSGVDTGCTACAHCTDTGFCIVTTAVTGVVCVLIGTRSATSGLRSVIATTAGTSGVGVTISGVGVATTGVVTGFTACERCSVTGVCTAITRATGATSVRNGLPNVTSGCVFVTVTMVASNGDGLANINGVISAGNGVAIGCGVSRLCTDTEDSIATTTATGATSRIVGLPFVIVGSVSVTVTTAAHSGDGVASGGVGSATTGVDTGYGVCGVWSVTGPCTRTTMAAGVMSARTGTRTAISGFGSVIVTMDGNNGVGPATTSGATASGSGEAIGCTV